MNKIYKLIWSKKKELWMAVSEKVATLLHGGRSFQSQHDSMLPPMIALTLARL